MLPERLRAGLAASLAAAALVAGAVGAGLVVLAPASAQEGVATAEPSATTTQPSDPATESPTETPTGSPTDDPTATPTDDPTDTPTDDPTATPTDDPTATPTPTPTPTGGATSQVEVNDAVLAWGVNNESSNRAFAPGTFNFFSAGRVPDPGRGGRTLRPADWSQRRGNVAVEKWDGARWRPATWAGLGTDAAGKPLGSPTAGTFSGHHVEFTGGTGVVDRVAGTARIAWDGDVTVLYYSGMSFFYLTDPVLEVAGGRGRLTATLSGFASSLEDQTKWEAVAPAQVTVADLPSVALRDERGLVTTPAYLGVTVTGVPQQTDGPSAGAFPQSYVDFMDRLGTAAFWYSSGAGTDAFKVPLPMTVSYDASRTVPEPAPTTAPTQEPIDPPTVQPPPTATPPPAPVAPLRPLPVPSYAGPVAAPAAGLVPAAAAALAGRPPTQVRLTAAPVADPAAHQPWLWWTGGALLLAAALVLLVPAAPARPAAPTGAPAPPRKDHP